METNRPWSLAQALYDHGLTARPHSDTDLVIEDDEGETTAQVRRLRRTPRAPQIERTHSAHPEQVQLFVVPSITPGALRLGAQYPFTAFVGMFDGDLVWKGEHHSLGAARLNPGQRGRQGWARWAVMRALLAPAPPMNQVTLAASAGVSQGSISNALRALRPFVARTDSGWIALEPEQLWDMFLETYPGVGVIRTHWFSLESPVEQSHKLATAIANASPRAQLLHSGDMGADIIAGWRIPTRTALYSDHAINPERVGFAAATASESTLDFVIPHDPTVWHTAKLFSDDPVADPLIVASELALNRAIDVDEAITRLKTQTLSQLAEASG